MRVVSNTSPIVNLSAVGRLGLLRQLYSRMLIPRAVYAEIAIVGKGQPGALEVETFDWIETRPATYQPVVASLQLELDEGEAEAIALAIELPADLLLLDERKGRMVALRLGLRSVGLLGARIEAKHQSLISAIKPVVDDLIATAGFWISQKLYEQVMHAARE